MLRKTWISCLIAVALVAVAAAFRVAYAPLLETQAPFLTFYPAVMLAAVVGGSRASLLATLLAAAISCLLILIPSAHGWAGNPTFPVRLATFVLNGVFISLIAWRRQRAVRRAVEAEAQVLVAAQRQESQEQVRSMEALHRAALQSLQLHIAVLDHDGCITAVNEAWSTFAAENGGSPGGVGVGSNYLAVCRRASAEDDPDAAAALSGIEQVLRGDLEQFTLEYPCHSPRRQRWFLMTVVPLKVSGTGGTVVTHLDITERRLLEDALFQQQNELQRTNELLEQRVMQRTADLQAVIREQESFSYSVSHDLRAPLRHINSYSTLLAEDFGDVLPPEGRGYLERIVSSCGRMGNLIDHLLELSRVTRAEIQLERVDLSALVRTSLERLREMDPRRQVRLVVQEGLCGFGDPYLLEQLLENLLGNAWKYTSKTPDPCIEFGRGVFGGKEAFYVRDNGAGFDMAYRDNLFKAFQRLHGADFEGIGIGLATAQRIIQRHGGEIWAEGAVGEGATFYFTLPLSC